MVVLQGLLSLALLLTASVSFAEDLSSPAATPSAGSPAVPSVSEKNISYLICKNQTAVRTLRVQTDEQGMCTTTYTKAGVDQVVSNSKKSEICHRVLSNIQENLEKAAWKCKDISGARVSFTAE